MAATEGTESIAPAKRAHSRIRASVLARIAVCGCALVIVVVATQSKWTQDLLDRLKGNVLVPRESVVEIAIPESAEVGNAAILLRNVTRSPVTIYRVQTCCGVSVNTRVPLTIEPACEGELLVTADRSAFSDRSPVRTIEVLVNDRSPRIIAGVTRAMTD